MIDQSIDMTWQIQLGRFLQPIYLLFRGDIAVPYLIGLLAYLYLAAAICLVVDLLSLSSTCLSRWSAWRCAPIRR